MRKDFLISTKLNGIDVEDGRMAAGRQFEHLHVRKKMW